MIDVLQQYWFTEKEAKVYLAVLSLGSAPWSTIARHAWENRVTVYTILRDLGERGIITHIVKGNMRFFSAIWPDVLLKQLEEKYVQFKEKVPYLLAMTQQNSASAKLTFYEGEQGIKNMYNDLLTSTITIKSFLGLDYSHAKHLIKYLQTVFVPTRVKSKIRANVIASQWVLNGKYAGIDKKSYRKTKIITNTSFILDGEINIYWPNKVSIATFSNNSLSWILIESEQIYTSLNSIFTLLWETQP
jgi:sugar-specific transcriptional regulator TrmB